MRFCCPSYCLTEEWRRLRERLLSRLHSEWSTVDEDIRDLLEAINVVKCLVTSSSCSGRVAVFSAPLPGDKRRGGIVAKWHRPVRPREIEEALTRAGKGFVWVSAQPIILGVHACSAEVAFLFVRAAERAGLKYSGVKLSQHGYYAYLLGTERIDIPVQVGDRQVKIDSETISSIVNSYISLAKRKLARLKRSLAAELPLIHEACEEATL